MTNRQRDWQLHEAKAQFSELFRRVRAVGPQRVVKRSGEAVVVVRAEDYERQARLAEQPVSLVDFLRGAPTAGEELDLMRKRDVSRTLDL
jgi:prevent-host-death family protein